jgi:AmmeMemoRadiSam system protein B
MSLQREPAVAGRFYPANPRQLDAEVTALIGNDAKRSLARALVVPHAGYVYSGAIAGRGYREVEVPATTIVLCPNHTGLGPRHSLWHEGVWRIPGGDVAVDRQLAESILERAQAASVPLQPDQAAHLHEHSIEVHLPFLRARHRQVKVVPICLARMTWHECEALGRAVAAAIAVPDEVLVVASTDMSHYVSARVADRLDHLALERVEALDPEGLLRVVAEHDISMCGVVPTAVALVTALQLGATSSRLVAYGNSGDTSGTVDRVVGYASVVIR